MNSWSAFGSFYFVYNDFITYYNENSTFIEKILPICYNKIR